jgi:hypothetical protein
MSHPDLLRNARPRKVRDEAHQEENQENKEQYLRDAGCGECHESKTEHTCYNCDEKEN